LREEEAARIDKARGLLWEDFKDRLCLFVSDLSQWQDGRNRDCVHHASNYFNQQEISQLSTVSCLYDEDATWEEILHSLEVLIPLFRFKLEGVWRYPTTEKMDWLKNEKECLPGSFRGIYADVLLEILPEEDRRETEERREAEKRAAAEKAKAERRKVCREKRKAEDEVSKSNSEGSSEPTEVNPSSKTTKRKVYDI